MSDEKNSKVCVDDRDQELDGNMALRRFHTVDIRVAEAGAGTLA